MTPLRSLRRLPVAVLPILLLALAVSSARAQPAGDDVTYGVPWTGAPGIRETVAAIMARELGRIESPDARPLPARQLKPRLRAPAKVREEPSAPAVPGWPAAEAAPSAEADPSPKLPQTVGTSFLGAAVSESGFIPPDSMGAVGPTQVLVVVNGRIKVFDKNGVLGALNTTTDGFFASVSTDSTSDPHVRYDRLSGRWFIAIIDVASVNRILIAVSDGATITNGSSFTFFGFQHDQVGTVPNADTGHFADYDTLGVDRFALYIGVNMFTQAEAFAGTTGFVVNKANLLADVLTVTAFRQLAGSTCPGTGVYTPQGVQNDDPQATEGYFIGPDLCTKSRLVLRRVSNPGGSPAVSGNLVVNVPTTTDPILQRHAGAAANRRLDAIDDRLFAASVHTNRITGTRTLWTAHNIEVSSGGVGTSGGGRNGSRWYEIGALTTTPALVQSGTMFDPAATTPFGYWMPSVAMSGQGHMALGASRASADASTGFASVAVAGRLRTDALGTTQAPTLAQSSSTAYNAEATDGQRWGDYSQVVVDPNDSMTMWTFQEYCNATDSWGVRAIRLTAPPPATPATASPPSVATGQASVNVTIDGTSVAGSEFFDPGPDTGGPGFSNHIAASIGGGGVTVNSVTFVTPTRVILNLSTLGATAGARNVTVINPDGQSRTGTGVLLLSSSGATLPPYDFNGDSRADILWRRTSGAVAVWLMNGAAVIGMGAEGVVPTDWTIAGAGDFNGDGKADILWRHSTGGIGIWFMNGTSVTGSASAGGVPPEWSIAGIGDFNGDGKADILLRHISGGVTVLLMNGAVVTAIGSLGGVTTDWAIVGVGDFNGDGKADILWRHSSGGVGIWFMNGTAIAGSASAGGLSPDWTVQKAADFNGDGKADILWRQVGGGVTIWLMNGAAIAGSGFLGVVSTDWSIAGARDFSGDGKADILWRHTTGGVGIWFMNGTTATGSGSAGGLPTDWVIQ